MCGGSGQVEIKRFENEAFHSDNLSLCVCVIRDVSEVSYLRWEDLLKLGGYVHSCGTHKLEF